MTAPITGARSGGLGFRLLGFPVTIHVSFLIVVTLLGFGIGQLDRVLLWVGIATVSILFHELGHALVARATGAAPRIDLAGFGGVTSWRPTRRSNRRRWRLATSLAGPGAGAALGLVGLAAGGGFPLTLRGDTAQFALDVLVFTSFGWSVLNLAPILPLDGGQALEQLVPGPPERRRRVATGVGLAVGAGLVAAALVARLSFAALVAGWLTWANGREWWERRKVARGGTAAGGAGTATGPVEEARRALPDDPERALELASEAASRASDAATRRRAVGTALVALELLDRVDEARAELDRLTPDEVEPLQVAGIRLRADGVEPTLTALRRQLEAAPDAYTAAVLLLALVHAGHDEEALALADTGEPVPVDALATAAHLAGGLDRPETASAFEQRWRARSGPAGHQ